MLLINDYYLLMSLVWIELWFLIFRMVFGIDVLGNFKAILEYKAKTMHTTASIRFKIKASLNEFWTLLYVLFLPCTTLLSALCLSIYLPVTASSLRGIDQSCSFMAQSTAYWPETCLKEGIFLEPVLGPMGGVWSSNPLYFPM